MKKGRMSAIQKQYVIEIRDVNLFSDSQLYTIWVLEEDVIRGVRGRFELKPDARVVEVKPQEEEITKHDVYISETVRKRVSERFARKKGVSD